MIDTALPDLTRPDVGTVLVAESPAASDVDSEVDTANVPWPTGLLSVSTFASTDGERVLTYTQWAPGDTDPEFVAGLTGAEPVEYTLYRQQVRENPPVPGCIVVIRAEFDGPDERRQRRFVDTVFEAMSSDPDPHPGGISGHFHLSTDGTRMLAYAEWTDEQAHRDAIARSEHGTVGSSPGWHRVVEFPGVKESGFRRYRLLRSTSVATEVLDSPTDWVAEHVRAYLETDGEEGHLYQEWPTLLLTTRGRKSGKLRRTALIYGQDSDFYLLVASNAGAATHPAWYLNLREHPDVTVQVRAETFPARARTATAEEKRRLWPVMTAIFPLYDTYQENATERDLPLVIIERRETSR